MKIILRSAAFFLCWAGTYLKWLWNPRFYLSLGWYFHVFRSLIALYHFQSECEVENIHFCMLQTVIWLCACNVTHGSTSYITQIDVIHNHHLFFRLSFLCFALMDATTYFQRECWTFLHKWHKIIIIHNFFSFSLYLFVSNEGEFDKLHAKNNRRQRHSSSK